jgi:hypothetical protein
MSVCILNMQAYTGHIPCSALTTWHCTIAGKPMQAYQRALLWQRYASAGTVYHIMGYLCAAEQKSHLSYTAICSLVAFLCRPTQNNRHRCGIMSVLLYDIWAQQYIAGEHGPGRTACAGLRVRSSRQYGLRLDSVRSLCYARKRLHFAVGLTVQSAAASGMHQREYRLCNST